MTVCLLTNIVSVMQLMLQLIHFKLMYTQSKSKCVQIEDV